MPTLNLLPQNLIHQSLLLQHIQPSKTLRNNLYPIHRPAASTYILNLQLYWFQCLAQLLKHQSLFFVKVLRCLQGSGVRRGASCTLRDCAQGCVIGCVATVWS